jgi:hypothetical protein
MAEQPMFTAHRIGVINPQRQEKSAQRIGCVVTPAVLLFIYPGEPREAPPGGLYTRQHSDAICHVYSKVQ